MMDEKHFQKIEADAFNYIHSKVFGNCDLLMMIITSLASKTFAFIIKHTNVSKNDCLDTLSITIDIYLNKLNDDSDHR